MDYAVKNIQAEQKYAAKQRYAYNTETDDYGKNAFLFSHPCKVCKDWTYTSEDSPTFNVGISINGVGNLGCDVVGWQHADTEKKKIPRGLFWGTTIYGK